MILHLLVELVTSAPTPSPSPIDAPAGTSTTTNSSTSIVLPVITLTAAVIAATVAGVSAFLQRRSGREAADAASRSAAAADRSSKAAQAGVELNADTARETAKRAHAEGLAKRYQDAASQLGNDNAAVRLAGVYSMARLADDWDQQRQTCVDVPCAYMRMSFQQETSKPSAQEDEVRASIVKSIAQRMVPGREFTWTDMAIDLSGSVIKGCDFTGAVFQQQPNFDDVRFEGMCLFDETLFPEGGLFRHIRQVGEDVESVKAPKTSYLSFDNVELGEDLDFHRAVIEPFSHFYVEPTRYGLGGNINISEGQFGGTVILTLTAQGGDKQVSLSSATLHDDATLRVQIAGDDRQTDEPLANFNLRGLETEPSQRIDIDFNIFARSSVRWSDDLTQAKGWPDLPND